MQTVPTGSPGRGLDFHDIVLRVTNSGVARTKNDVVEFDRVNDATLSTIKTGTADKGYAIYGVCLEDITSTTGSGLVKVTGRATLKKGATTVTVGDRLYVDVSAFTVVTATTGSTGVVGWALETAGTTTLVVDANFDGFAYR